MIPGEFIDRFINLYDIINTFCNSTNAFDNWFDKYYDDYNEFINGMTTYLLVNEDYKEEQPIDDESINAI